MVPLLSPFYFGSVEHYRLLAQHPRAIIDTGEHYVRQSYRTRTTIVGPNGRQDLLAQVEHGGGRKLPLRDVRLSYAETWPQQHLHAIRTAYGQTPWFIHFIDAIEAVLLARHERLIDLELTTMKLGMAWLGITTELEIRSEYVTDISGMLDLRTAFHPKRPLPPVITPVPPYPQVFADRHGFQERVSIIDLVCNRGSQARAALLA